MGTWVLLVFLSSGMFTVSDFTSKESCEVAAEEVKSLPTIILKYTRCVNTE